jgi:hypothetical protein
MTQISINIITDTRVNRQPLPIPLISTPDGDLYFTDKKGTSHVYVYIHISICMYTYLYVYLCIYPLYSILMVIYTSHTKKIKFVDLIDIYTHI